MIKVPSVFAPSKTDKKIALLLSLASTMLASTQLANAEWRKDIGVFRIGISSIDEKPIRPEKLEPFRVAMSAALEMPVEIFLARNAAALMDAMASSRIEYAIVSAIGYATLDSSCKCVEPLVAPIGANGIDAFRSTLVVNADKIQSLADLPGRKIALGPSYSVAGHMLPMSEFKIGGFTFAEAHVKLEPTKDLESAIQLTLAEQVDGFFGWEQVVVGTDKMASAPYDRLLENHQMPMVTLWNSQPIRFGPHIVHQSVAREAKQLLRDILPKLHEIAPLAFDSVSPDMSGSLVPVDADDYRAAKKLVETLENQSTGSVRQ